ncbi:MAG: hypothetical protein JWM78_3601 [Verrucomicrobiaceae bacterium]|nr:hypothetical protein [Verrucomicrobiaceae bacterium]
MTQPQKATAYLLSGCPFCFKFLLFMTEAKLLDQIEISVVDPQNPATEHLKNKIADATQAKASFPAVEIEPGVFKLDSDKLIEYYAEKNNVPKELPVLSFYKDGLFTQYVNLYKENIALKQQVKDAG